MQLSMHSAAKARGLHRSLARLQPDLTLALNARQAEGWAWALLGRGICRPLNPLPHHRLFLREYELARRVSLFQRIDLTVLNDELKDEVGELRGFECKTLGVN